MATLTATDMRGVGAVAVTENTLTASDTFTYRRNRDPLLVLINGTAGALTVTIDGNGGTSVAKPGVGSIDVSGGFSTPEIAVGEEYAIRLNSIYEYLQGTIAVTGGTGITAYLMEF